MNDCRAATFYTSANDIATPTPLQMEKIRYGLAHSFAGVNDACVRLLNIDYWIAECGQAKVYFVSMPPDPPRVANDIAHPRWKKLGTAQHM